MIAPVTAAGNSGSCHLILFQQYCFHHYLDKIKSQTGIALEKDKQVTNKIIEEVSVAFSTPPEFIATCSTWTQDTYKPQTERTSNITKEGPSA